MAKQMTLDQYCDFVSELASKASMRTFKSRLGTSGLGLSGEAGEIADTVKKLLFHGKPWSEDLRKELIDELSDVMWYCAFMARNVLKVSLQDIIDRNVEKLSARYKTGKFTSKEFLAKERAKKRRNG